MGLLPLWIVYSFSAVFDFRRQNLLTYKVGPRAETVQAGLSDLYNETHKYKSYKLISVIYICSVAYIIVEIQHSCIHA